MKTLVIHIHVLLPWTAGGGTTSMGPYSSRCVGEVGGGGFNIRFIGDDVNIHWPQLRCSIASCSTST